MLFPLAATDVVAKLGIHQLVRNGAEKAMSCIYISWDALQFICKVRLTGSSNVIWEITRLVLPSGCKAMKALLRDERRRIWSLKKVSSKLNTRKSKAQRRASERKVV